MRSSMAVTAATSPSNFPQSSTWAIGSEQRARALVAPHDDLQQILSGRQRQLAHTEVIDDEQRYRGHRLHELLAFTLHDGFGEFLQQDMRLPIDHAIVLLDGGLTDGLSQVTFPCSSWPQEKCIFPLADEGTRSQIEHQAAIHLRVEGEVEVVQSLMRVAEGSLFAPAIQESLTAAGQLVAHQTGDQIDRRHGFSLRLTQSGFQHGGGTAEPELS